MSLYRASKESWFSTRPGACDVNADRIQQIADQLITIHEQILISGDQKDTFHVSYSDLCSAPKHTLESLAEFCSAQDIDIELTTKNIPDSFEIRKSNTDGSTADKLAEAIRLRLNRAQPKTVKFFSTFQPN